MSHYETACSIICDVHDQDRDSLLATINKLRHSELAELVVMLAAMASPDAGSPAGVIAARSRFLAVAPKPVDPTATWFAELVGEAADAFHIDPASIYEDRRGTITAAARHTVCWIASNNGLSASEIGRNIGRDHSTILNSLRVVGRSPELQAKAQVIEGRLLAVAS